MNTPNDNAPTQIIFWILWASILSGLIFIIQFVGGGFPMGESKQEPSSVLFLATLSGALVSTFIRWFIAPKINNLQSLLSLFIIGLALAESTGILGAFLIGSEFPSEQRIAYALSIITILQYIPICLPKIDKAE